MNDLKISISTCPNDTFMFDALLHGRIDAGGLRFDRHMADIAELNGLVLKGEPDLSKISYAVYPQIEREYQILTAGGALGRGNGPLLVSKRKICPDEVKGLRIAVPGLTTTANMLLTIAFGEIRERKEYLFSDISAAVGDGEADAGVLIHEERFLYREKGLRLVADLGECWERRSGGLIPLGAIVVRRSLPETLKRRINALVEESVRYAWAHPEASRRFVREHARELDEGVVGSHIRMFVNEYSADLGTEGKKSVADFFEAAGARLAEPIFI